MDDVLQKLEEELGLEIDNLPTSEESFNRIHNIQSLWNELDDSLKTEELMLRIITKIATTINQQGRVKRAVSNVDEVLEIYQSYPEKTTETFLDVIKAVWQVSNSKELLATPENRSKKFTIFESMPEELKNRTGYMECLKAINMPISDVVKISELFIPEDIRDKSFYEDYIELQEGNEISVYNRLLDEIPGNDVDTFLKISSKVNNSLVMSMLERHIEYATQDVILKLTEIIANKKNVTEYDFRRFLNLIPEGMRNQEVYENIFNVVSNIEIDGRKKTVIIASLLKNVPENFLSEQKIYELEKLVPIESYEMETFMGSIPQKYRVAGMYEYFLDKVMEVADERPYKIDDLYKGVYKRIPNEAKTAEMLIKSLKILQEEKIFEDMKLLEQDLRNKNLYTKLMERFMEKELVVRYNNFLKNIPEEFLTEENLLAMFKNKNKRLGSTQRLFDTLMQEGLTLSYDFFKELFSNVPDSNRYGTLMYSSIPDKFKTDEMFYCAIKGSVQESSGIGALIQKYSPKEESPIQIGNKIIDIISDSQESMSKKFDAYLMADISLRRLLYNANIRRSEEKDRMEEKIFSKVKNYVNENGQTIYTPQYAMEMLNAFMGGSKTLRFTLDEKFSRHKELIERNRVLEYFYEIIDAEKDNILNKRINIAQIQEYERELYGEGKSQIEKNPFWSLNAIYYIIPEKLQYHYKEQVVQFIKNNLRILENGENSRVMSFIAQMYENNEDLFYTMDNRFIQTDKYINLFGEDKFEILSAFSDIQITLFNLDEQKLNLFSNFINYVPKDIQMQESQNIDWVPIADGLCKCFKNKEFNELSDNFKKLNFEELPDELKQKYLHIVTKSHNWFEIKSIEDLKNYETKRKEICAQILKEPDKLDGIPYSIKSLEPEQRIIFARLQLQFGLDLEEAENLINKYGKGLNEEQKKEGIGIYLQKLQEILNVSENNLEKLSDIDVENIGQTNFSLMQNFEAKCRESYMKQYQKVLYNPIKNESDLTTIDAEYEGKKIQVFEPGKDFRAIVHSLGAYSDHSKREDYRADWNMPKVASHGVCTSFIGNNSLATARIESVMYGFDDFSPEQLLLSSPWDIASNEANKRFSISSVKYNYGTNIKFCSPKEQIDNTRHTHNEMVFERRKFFKGKSAKKMQPSYIVYMPDYMEGKKAEDFDEILENRDSILKEFMEKDPRWKEAQKAAAQFGVPIVMIDRARVAQRESANIEETLEKFEETRNTDLIYDVINEFENNRTGAREYHQSICERYFSVDTLDGYIKRIEQAIETLPTKQQREEAYETLKQVYDSEIEKRNQYRKTDNDPITKYWESKSYACYTRNTKIKQTQELEIETVIDTLTHDESVQVPEVDRDVVEEIRDMKSRKLYKDKEAHSDRHIQDVMLFSSILGKKLNLPDEDQKLLIEAAKFHDSGRKGDSDRNHAKPSAEIAEKSLKGQYTEDQIKIIQVAIAYHEPMEAEKGKMDNKLLQKLYEEYGLKPEYQERAMLISKLLKDADSLDRTRFVGRSKLDPSFLHTEEAKELVEFSKQINEQYAQMNLEIICSENENLRESIMEFRKENGESSLYTDWAIRRHRFVPRKSKESTLDELEQNAKDISQKEVIEVEQQMVEFAEKDLEQEKVNSIE